MRFELENSLVDSENSPVLFMSFRKDISVWSTLSDSVCGFGCFGAVAGVSVNLVGSSLVGMDMFCDELADDSDAEELPEEVEIEEEQELEDSITFNVGLVVVDVVVSLILDNGSLFVWLILPVVPIIRKSERFFSYKANKKLSRSIECF